MPRTLWKGAISFGLVHIPVGLYSAEKRNNFDLTMLDRRAMKPVGFKRYNKETGEDVSWDDIVKGYEYEKDRYVVLTEEDFKRANVEATQTVEILSFVDGKEIAPLYFETPYYLAPDKRGHKGYALLRETLRETGKVGIANVVIRTRQYVAALLPMDDVIVMNTLRYAGEIRAADEFDLPSRDLAAVGVSPREIEMATKLVDGMTEAWQPDRYRDTYHEDLMALIEKRIEAGQTETITEPAEAEEERPARGEVVDLMALLKRSVEEKAKDRRTGAQGKKGRAEREAKRKTA
ncbi:Ku protein [Nitrospira moscoviensis]|uniref:Non-homologous end joining protein Ku n=1 Tax=Nitrospira moscoviensis TaxID=42253 RepID=A0A0K2GF14_NITMO|nr:Ku protein [Nitrospira moscoviensis]ALA59202.1 putative DNA repair protein, Ku type [Nitrospira moscoviensis]